MAYKEEAIKEMALAIMDRGLALTAKDAVDVASPVVNYVDECRKCGTDPLEGYGLLKPYKGQEMFDALHGFAQESGLDPIAALGLVVSKAVQHEVETRDLDVEELFDKADDILGQVGWKG